MILKKIIFNICTFGERVFAYLLGKGYGSFTINQEIMAVKSLLSRSPILAIDVGGNIGNYSKELRSKFPNLEIHIFEPSGLNITKLKSIFNGDGHIHINSLALSDNNAEASLYSDKPGSGLGSLINRRLNHFDIMVENVEEIQTIRFEDYWKKSLSSRPIDLVKLDIEGFELAALRGFGSALTNTKVIQFEFGGCNLDTRTNFQDFYYLFKELNFKIYRITPLGLQEITRYREMDEVFLTTNFLAVNNCEI